MARQRQAFDSARLVGLLQTATAQSAWRVRRASGGCIRVGKIEGSWHRASSRSGPTDIAATCLLRFARTASYAGAGQSISQRWGTGSVGTADRLVAGVATVRREVG